MKRFDLMHSVNGRGTFLITKCALPYLLKAKNPHVLNMSPPLNMASKWFSHCCAYSMSKYFMSMCTLGMSKEFEGKVSFNSMWPKTYIATAAVMNILGGDKAIAKSRKPEIVGDAAHVLFMKDFKTCTGNFFTDE